jgi:hypothetical protein
MPIASLISWMMNNITTMATRLTPNGHGLARLAPGHNELLEDMRIWSECISLVLARARRLHEALGLEDQTKTI